MQTKLQLSARRWRLGLLSFLGLAALGLVVLAILPRGPEGRYRFKGIANGGVGYLEFSNNVIALVSEFEGGASRRVFGSYHEIDGKWYCINAYSETNLIEYSILGMKVSHPTGVSEHFPRIFLPILESWIQR